VLAYHPDPKVAQIAVQIQSVMGTGVVSNCGPGMSGIACKVDLSAAKGYDMAQLYQNDDSLTGDNTTLLEQNKSGAFALTSAYAWVPALFILFTLL
jgi:hypothetical protein